MNAKEIESFWSKVDKSGTCWLWTGARTKAGYGKLMRQRKTIYAHRYAFQAQGIEIPPGMQVDHICHTLTCVRPAHLRIVTPKQNMENRSGARKGTKSGIRGVFWHAASNRWGGVAVHNGKYVSAGYFADIRDAERAAVALRNELFTHNDVDRMGDAA